MTQKKLWEGFSGEKGLRLIFCIFYQKKLLVEVCPQKIKNNNNYICDGILYLYGIELDKLKFHQQICNLRNSQTIKITINYVISVWINVYDKS